MLGSRKRHGMGDEGASFFNKNNGVWPTEEALDVRSVIMKAPTEVHGNFGV